MMHGGMGSILNVDLNDILRGGGVENKMFNEPQIEYHWMFNVLLLL